jgi:hypothetical protein
MQSLEDAFFTAILVIQAITLIALLVKMRGSKSSVGQNGSTITESMSVVPSGDSSLRVDPKSINQALAERILEAIDKVKRMCNSKLPRIIEPSPCCSNESLLSWKIGI